MSTTQNIPASSPETRAYKVTYSSDTKTYICMLIHDGHEIFASQQNGITTVHFPDYTFVVNNYGFLVSREVGTLEFNYEDKEIGFFVAEDLDRDTYMMDSHSWKLAKDMLDEKFKDYFKSSSLTNIEKSLITDIDKAILDFRISGVSSTIPKPTYNPSPPLTPPRTVLKSPTLSEWSVLNESNPDEDEKVPLAI